MPFFPFAPRLRFLTLLVIFAAATVAGSSDARLMAQTAEPPIAPAAIPAPPPPGAKLNKPPFELPAAFHAEVQTTKGSTISTCKFYATDGKVRLETKSRDLPVVVIGLLKEKRALMLVPDKANAEKGVYIERDLSAANLQALDLRTAWNDPKVTWESMPPTAVDGVECDVYKLTRAAPGKPGEPPGPGTTHTMYLNPATRLPLKVIVVTPDGESTQLWSNVTVGAQDEALFKQPAGYIEKQN